MTFCEVAWRAALVTAVVGAAAARVRAEPSATASVEADTFVRVRGNQLLLDGRPFHFVGANLAIMHGPENRAAADAVLVGAAADGVRVGRVWALGEGDVDAAPWIRENFLFRAGPDGWVEAAVLHLDQVVAAAGRAGVRLIITLSNSWADYGGVPRYLRWARRWTDGVYGVSDRFYSDARARAAFRAHVERLLQRTNHLTGVRYRDDPTIMAWELMNESSISTTSGAVARRAWIVEMARFIHARDPNHLVTPGISGYRFERERQDWLQICRLTEIDFCDGHLYPEELLRNRESASVPAAVEALIDDYVRLAQTLAGKPFVLGEFGIRGEPAASAGSRDRSWQGHGRAWWTGAILDRLRFDGAAGGLIWIYQGPKGADPAHGITVDRPGADAGADAIRAEIATAARKLRQESIPTAGAAPARNPAVAAVGGTLMPLHTIFTGQSRAVPFVNPQGARPLSITWDPLTYTRADWESSGVYTGGPWEHAWGGETGWFEYEYVVTGTAPTTSVASFLLVRARVSSEYPGSVSPPDGASRFEVSLDGIPLGKAMAPPDDGRGRWVTLRVQLQRLALSPLSPGPHRLRFSVLPGPRAHGLSLYGRLGAKPISTENAVIELQVHP